jgi:quercetin dioxygenase-like cupin family protein
VIVRSLDEVIGTERDVAGDGWRSRRILLRDDGMSFSLHDTVVEAGAELEMEYRNHLEACYVVQGRAELTDHATGEQHELEPGSVYALNDHDRHTLRVRDELHLVCVFNPALAGTERHVGGGYEPTPER